jgi:Secretion system C-terminal sorting domain
LGYGKDIVTTSVSGIPSPRKMEVEIFPNPQSTIGFVRVELSRAASSSIRIYNSLGMLVHEIHDSYLDAGMHSFSWNPAMLPAGIYFCIVQSGLIRNSSHVMIIR